MWLSWRIQLFPWPSPAELTTSKRIATSTTLYTWRSVIDACATSLREKYSLQLRLRLHVVLSILRMGWASSIVYSFSVIISKSETWCVDRGRWVMHDGMSYDPIQGQGQGHIYSKVRISSIFKLYLLHHLQWQLANDHWF